MEGLAVTTNVIIERLGGGLVTDVTCIYVANSVSQSQRSCIDL